MVHIRDWISVGHLVLVDLLVVVVISAFNVLEVFVIFLNLFDFLSVVLVIIDEIAIVELNIQ